VPVTQVVRGGGAAGAAPTAAAVVDPCTILTLVLGPLHLDLLGLVVDLSQINLTITGQTGPGQLLGNLLCGLAGLLDQTGSLSGLLNNTLNQIVMLLNQILAAL
jgi:hypothetical protein